MYIFLNLQQILYYKTLMLHVFVVTHGCGFVMKWYPCRWELFNVFYEEYSEEYTEYLGDREGKNWALRRDISV
jgi:hypothetical protein